MVLTELWVYEETALDITIHLTRMRTAPILHIQFEGVDFDAWLILKSLIYYKVLAYNIKKCPGSVIIGEAIKVCKFM